MPEVTDDNASLEVQRVDAIDALRGSAVLVWGVAVALTPVLYSLPESGWRLVVVDQLSPSIWHGMTLYDFMLPAFLVAAGAGVVFDLERRCLNEASNTALVKRIVIRAAVLFFLGLICEWLRVVSLAEMRWTGVFQRIAVCYLIAGLFGVFSGWRTHAVVAAVILLEYGLVFELVDVPGYGVGDFSVEGNVAAYTDRLWLPGRLYFSTWDPQGLISTLPAIAVTLFGMLLGRYLLHSRNAERDDSLALMLIGLVALNAGLYAGEWMPVNAYINTPTFAVAACGATLSVVGLVGLLAKWGGTFVVAPLCAIGRNALLLMICLALIPTLGNNSMWLMLIAAVLAAMWLAQRRCFLTLSRVVPG
ncbi:hypothetical protein Pan258_51020 [Symmachiella dynata]|uniref:heparan-alpha-glucosaminide N-acetyltransferase domain-containing protein n=1 Tax=Symmachiella dynata TaxID=2527995 RepID=UPI001188F237|nr:DUF5009 domain-containing protein [Symmachiella dynata]QDT51019.1 hypothetical protein Pan258_51020 [Symmachiella dynata]